MKNAKKTTTATVAAETKLIKLNTKASTTYTRSLNELKADVDARLERELLVAASVYEASRRVELGLST